MSEYPRAIPTTPPEERPPEVVRVEVTPGKVQQVVMPADMRAGRVVHQEVPGVPGLWREVKKVHRPLVKLTDDMEGLEATGLSRRDVLTLAFAGMVRAYRPGLQTTLVDPATLWRHIYRTQLGPDGGKAAEYWQDRARVRDFSEASQEVQARGLVSRESRRDAREAESGQAMMEL